MEVLIACVTFFLVTAINKKPRDDLEAFFKYFSFGMGCICVSIFLSNLLWRY